MLLHPVISVPKVINNFQARLARIFKVRSWTMVAALVDQSSAATSALYLCCAPAFTNSSRHDTRNATALPDLIEVIGAGHNVSVAARQRNLAEVAQAA